MQELEVENCNHGTMLPKDALLAGKAVQAYVDYTRSRDWAAKVADGVPHEVWYTERNGDPITMIVPEGTQDDSLPSKAMEYAALEWIRPEDQFNSNKGVVPVRYRRKKGG